MPKFTDEKVIGGSEIPIIVLQKGRFTTPNEILRKKNAFKLGQNYQEEMPVSEMAIRRGNYLEPGILNWASD